MRKSKLAQIEAELMRLQEGNLTEPIKVEGVGIYRMMHRRLETLRLTLLKLQDEGVDAATRTNNAIASVAHDMKTPLAVISGYAECMSDGMDDKDYPSLILQKTQQMNEMVLSLVEDSRRELQKNKERKTITDARVYFGEAIARMRPVAEAKGIELKNKKTPSAQVRLDAYQFGRVIQNLITNAVKYSPSGTTITISYSVWAKYLYIRVKDQGEGIAKDSLPYIFDQFYKEDKTRADGASNGLGLYITREIVRDHGGRIYVKSKKGKGSTFVVAIPVEPPLEEKLTFTGRFDRLQLPGKLALEVFFGWLLASLYRVVRFFETRNFATLWFGVLCIALFPFVWLIDFLSVAVYGRITFLAD